VVQVRELYQLLKFMMEFGVPQRDTKKLLQKNMMTVKLEMGFTNIDLVESFRFSCDAIAGYIYQQMVNLINNKANGLLLGGAACLHCWVNLFPVFAEKI
jgi:hypothetical protein